jgi:hypothetical protein
VNIFTTAKENQQASDGNKYYANGKHEIVSFWHRPKRACMAHMVSLNSMSLRFNIFIAFK